MEGYWRPTCRTKEAASSFVKRHKLLTKEQIESGVYDPIIECESLLQSPYGEGKNQKDSRQRLARLWLRLKDRYQKEVGK